MVEQFLHCFSLDKPKQWFKWLVLAKYWYSTNIHASTKLILFEAVYSYPPPKLLKFTEGTTSVQAVEKTLKSRDAILAILCSNLQLA